MIFSAIFILGKAGAESMPAQEDHNEVKEWMTEFAALGDK